MKCLLSIGVTDLHPVKLFVDPTVVLVSTRVEDAVIDRLDPEYRTRGSVNGESE